MANRKKAVIPKPIKRAPVKPTSLTSELKKRTQMINETYKGLYGD